VQSTCLASLLARRIDACLGRFQGAFGRACWTQLRGSPLGSRLARGAFWSISGAVLSRALGLLGSILLARVLGRTAFGELGTIQSTVGLFGTFAGLSLGLTATKHVAELRENDKNRCGRVLGISLATAFAAGIVAGLVLLLLGKWLAVRTLVAPHLAPSLRLGGLLVLLATVQGAYLGALAGFEAFKQTAWVNLAGGLVGVPCIVCGGVLAGIEGAVLGMVLQTAMTCALSHAALAGRLVTTGIALSFKTAPGELRMLWGFALPSLLSGIVATSVGWFSRMILVNEPGGYGEIAVVSAANQWMNLMTFIPGVMGGVLAPILASLRAANHWSEFKRLVRFNAALNAGLSGAIALPVILLAPVILGLYGSDFEGGGPVFRVVMLTGVLISVSNVLSRSLQCAGLAWTDFSCNVVWAAGVLAGSWFLIQTYKGIGWVAAHAMASVALAGWQGVLVWKALERHSASAAGGDLRQSPS
jgi:O-antigen/teichoic acid export membrane protein